MAAEKRERERRERQHAQLAKMERDRKLREGILEEVRSLHRPAAATVANAAMAKAVADKKKAVAAFGGALSTRYEQGGHGGDGTRGSGGHSGHRKSGSSGGKNAHTVTFAEES